MKRISVFFVLLVLCVLVAAPARAADFQFGTLRMASTEGVGGTRANGSWSTGVVVLLHTELLNYGDTVERLNPDGTRPVDENGNLIMDRKRTVAVDFCPGAGAQGGGDNVNHITAPAGLCVVGMDIISLGGHYDFSNRAPMVTLTANLLNLPSTMVPLWNTAQNWVVNMFAGSPTQ
jgi:hypothetical protein